MDHQEQVFNSYHVYVSGSKFSELSFQLNLGSPSIKIELLVSCLDYHRPVSSVGSVSINLHDTVMASRGRLRTHTLIEKSRALSSLCCGLVFVHTLLTCKAHLNIAI